MDRESGESALESQTAVALREWLSKGPPVAVLEGFHGVGKTDSVIKLLQYAGLPFAHVRATSSGDLGLQDLLLNVAGELEVNGNSLMADALDEDQLTMLGAALRQSCLVVIDDFTELLDSETALPPRSFISFLKELEKRPSAAGRLLLVTDRRLSLSDDLYMETIRLGPPAEADAIRLLGKMLEIRKREDEIHPSRRLDVVRWLGCNPRAFQALVACLEVDTLDDLISAERENWDQKDEGFSPALIKELERRFRTRTLSRLSPAGLLLMEFLSIYRRPFVVEGVNRFTTPIGDIASARRELVDLFLLDHNRRWFFLNRVSRELALARLRAEPQHVLDAHSLAADHYCRHFLAKGPVDLAAHAAEFVEARYHLTHADRADEFIGIASRYRNYLLGNLHRLHAVPRSEEERMQRVATLTAALPDDQRGYPLARFTLARLLQESPFPGDKVRALRQVTFACRESIDGAAWVLRLRLSAQLETPATTLSIVRQAEETLSENAMMDVYYAAAKALADEGLRATELVTLVNNSMRRHSSDPDAWKLFQLGAAILARLRRYDEAIDLLRGYLSNVASEDMSFKRRLIEQTLLMGYATQRRDKLLSLELLADASGHRALFNCLRALLDGDFEAAYESVHKEPDTNAAAIMQAAFISVCLGYPSRAQKRLSRLHRHYGRAQYWLSSLTALSLGEMEVARTGLEAYVGRELRGDESLTLATWVKVWDATAGSLDSNASFYFPRLPGELTGLDHDLIRLQDTDYILDTAILAQILDRPPRREEEPEDAVEEIQEPVTEVLANAAPTLISIVKVSQEGIQVGDKNIVGQAAAVGSHASASNVTLQQVAGLTGVDMGVLSQELERLRIALRELPTSDENDEALAEVSRAQRAAIEGDQAKVVSHLRASGQWALRTANAIGATVAAAAIRHALGL